MVFPNSMWLMLFNTLISSVQIAVEMKQIRIDGWNYLSHAYNYLDVGGNIAIMLTGFNYVAYTTEFYKSENRKAILIFGIIGLGLRALS